MGLSFQAAPPYLFDRRRRRREPGMDGGVVKRWRKEREAREGRHGVVPQAGDLQLAGAGTQGLTLDTRPGY